MFDDERMWSTGYVLSDDGRYYCLNWDKAKRLLAVKKFKEGSPPETIAELHMKMVELLSMLV